MGSTPNMPKANLYFELKHIYSIYVFISISPHIKVDRNQKIKKNEYHHSYLVFLCFLLWHIMPSPALFSCNDSKYPVYVVFPLKTIDFCGSKYLNVTTEAIHLKSIPFYPYPYPNNVFCTWLVTCPTGALIDISFEYFHLQTNLDFLMIGRGPRGGTQLGFG